MGKRLDWHGAKKRVPYEPNGTRPRGPRPGERLYRFPVSRDGRTFDAAEAFAELPEHVRRTARHVACSNYYHVYAYTPEVPCPNPDPTT